MGLATQLVEKGTELYNKGDADGFCTLRDCHADSECPGGEYCAQKRDPPELCNSNPQKGNDDTCGTTKDPCVAASDFMTGGATYVEGPVCLMRNRGTPRGQGAPGHRGRMPR